MEHYDFRAIMRQFPGKFAGIGWLCISKRYRRHRGLLIAMLKMIIRESKKRGVEHLIAPLHPAILSLLERFGARAVDNEFFSKELKVFILPIHIDLSNLPLGIREYSQDPLKLLFEDSNERRIYRQGGAIIEKGCPNNEAFLVMRGSVEMLANPGVQLTKRTGVYERDELEPGNPLLGPGQVFGELAFLDGKP